MNEVTKILQAMKDTGSSAAEDLMPLVYEELRKLAASKMAKEASGQTLQATALVHEAWLRVSNGDNEWEDRGHFFAAAAEAMRRILVDNARRKKALKHGGNMERVDLEGVNVVAKSDDEELIAVHEVLGELEKEDPVVARLVKLRFFAGLTIDDAALALDVSRSTAKRHWNYARAWLYRAIQQNR
jgi:RNA polymerase sigma factor (TIGR02999 family)